MNPRSSLATTLRSRDDTVLLVKRKNHPGKGLWAFPAGYFNAADRVTSKGEVVKADKTVFECAVRELFEETKANVTKDDFVWHWSVTRYSMLKVVTRVAES